MSEAQLQTLWANGAKAWADVPNASQWVEELRGNVEEKRMSDTPRTDAAWGLCIELDARFPMHDLSTQLERELNAANERIKRLERDLYLQSRQIGRMCEVGDQMAAWLNCERNLGNDTYTAHLWVESKKPLQ